MPTITDKDTSDFFETYKEYVLAFIAETFKKYGASMNDEFIPLEYYHLLLHLLLSLPPFGADRCITLPQLEEHHYQAFHKAYIEYKNECAATILPVPKDIPGTLFDLDHDEEFLSSTEEFLKGSILEDLSLPDKQVDINTDPIITHLMGFDDDITTALESEKVIVIPIFSNNIYQSILIFPDNSNNTAVVEFCLSENEYNQGTEHISAIFKDYLHKRGYQCQCEYQLYQFGHNEHKTILSFRDLVARCTVHDKKYFESFLTY